MSDGACSRCSGNTCRLKDLPHLIGYAYLELFSYNSLQISLISTRLVLSTDRLDLSSTPIVPKPGGPGIPPWNVIFLGGGIEDYNELDLDLMS